MVCVRFVSQTFHVPAALSELPLIAVTGGKLGTVEWVEEKASGKEIAL